MTAAAAACLALALAVACSDDASATAPTARRDYGVEKALGNGKVRSYITRGNDGKPTEVGVAFSEAAMENLPSATAGANAHAAHAGAAHAMEMMTEVLLDLPADHGTQYKFVQLDWNPAGHEPAGVYDLPHFDFHFYNITKAERDQIDPANPQFVSRARNVPDAQYARAFFVNAAVAVNAPAEAVVVPRMGLHWLDTKSPELQGLVGNPVGIKPFTATFIQGSWNGQFIFEEPMITRAHIMAKKGAVADSVRDQVLPLTSAAKASPAGYYPTSYRITYDPSAKEYRVALSGLTYRN